MENLDSGVSKTLETLNIFLFPNILSLITMLIWSFYLERLFLQVKVIIVLFNLESLVFQVKVGVSLIYLESMGPIYTPLM